MKQVPIHVSKTAPAIALKFSQRNHSELFFS